MNAAKYFLDTNIFIYSYDPRNASKQQKALDLVQRTIEEHKGIISFQVVQEFLSLMTAKFNHKLTTNDLKDYLNIVLLPLCSVFPSDELYRQALGIHASSRIAFYDALIVAAASMAGCSILYTEDLQHGQVINGVKIQNPFL